MKIRKTRIKKTTKANGGVEYYPEYKNLFFWHSMYSWDSPDAFIWSTVTKWYKWTQAKSAGHSLLKSEQHAKEVIDFYIEQVNYKNTCKIENKLVKTEYEDYP